MRSLVKTQKLKHNFTTENSLVFGKKKTRRQEFKDNLELILLAFPAVLYFFFFHYLPMFGVIIAFKDYVPGQNIIMSPWIGFRNFEFLFKSQDAIRITTNTVGYGVIFIITGTVSAVVLALLLFEITNKIALKSYQTIMILPNFLSWVIVGFITYILFNPVYGVLNQFLVSIGLSRIEWYSDPKYWPTILTITNIWKGVGMGSVMYYAALMGIDSEIFEAAKIDGASKLQQIFNISIPSIIPLVTILSIMAVGNILKGDFGLFYQIPRDVGSLYPTTDIIDTYVYRGLRTGDLGMTAAVGFFQSFVGMIMVLATNQIVKKINPENSMF
jgi:putative aldouronate transport system permease protein